VRPSQSSWVVPGITTPNLLAPSDCIGRSHIFVIYRGKGLTPLESLSVQGTTSSTYRSMIYKGLRPVGLDKSILL